MPVTKAQELMEKFQESFPRLTSHDDYIVERDPHGFYRFAVKPRYVIIFRKKS